MIVEPFIPFILFVLALYATPGPATLSVFASGAAFGFRNTIVYIIGLITGLITIFVMVALGLGLIFSQYPTVHLIFKWISLIYIFYLAYKIATATPAGSKDSQRLGFVQGIGLNFLNPKAYFAVIATVSQFTKSGEQYYASFILLIVWVICLATVINMTWSYIGSVIGVKLGNSRFSSQINFVFALLMIASVLVMMFLE